MTVFSCNAPAKINLHLAVGLRQHNGFHLLESIFLALDFGDTLQFELSDEESGRTELLIRTLELDKTLTAGLCDLPPEKNLAVKAAALVRAKTGFKKNLSIILTKRIPAGAGLGGGSSDAAAVLRALAPYTAPFDMHGLAAELGSDVPFFLGSPAALVRGQGEIIKPVTAPFLFLVLIRPAFSSATARAFRLLDEARRSFSVQASSSSEIIVPAARESDFAEFAEEQFALPPERWSFTNDFWRLFLEQGTEEERIEYTAIAGALQEAGAVFVSLSGSGSTCFGVFKSELKGRKAEHALHGRWPFVRFCRTTGTT
jgi:4-diphosphocytidyl-2-C-methyl-D-erythritol kinase